MSKQTSAEWFTKSWNPISGRCPHNCVDLEGKQYCWMWRPKTGIADRFKKTHDHPLLLNEKILNHPPRSGRVLVGSSTDMFADSVNLGWIEDVFFKIYEMQIFYESIIWYFLTKNPYKYIEIVKNDMQLPNTAWYGTSYDGTESNRDNIAILKSLHQTTWSSESWTPKKFISFEPLLKEPPPYLDLTGIGWIIIGADSRKGKPKPPKEWADYLIAEARAVGAMVFVKDNYNYPEIIKEMPC
jgi:protein gp37